MNKFQELRNIKKEIFSIKIKFWYFLKYYLKNFFLNTILKTDFRASNITILILTKDELHKINDVLSSYSYVLERWIYNWEGWYTLDNEYSVYLFYKNWSFDFDEKKELYLKFFQAIKCVFSSKNLLWEKQILLKFFWYHSLLTVFKLIVNSIHLVWLRSRTEYEHYIKSITNQFSEPNKLLREFINMNEEDFENEMRTFYDLCYWFDITKFYYSIFSNVNLDFMKLKYIHFFNIDFLKWISNVEKTKNEYVFNDLCLEFFFLSFYFYFEKIQKFNKKYWIKFRKLSEEQEKSDYYSVCQLVDKHIEIRD